MARSKTKASRTKSAPAKKTGAKNSRSSCASATPKKTRKCRQVSNQPLESPQPEVELPRAAQTAVEKSAPVNDACDDGATVDTVTSDPMIVPVDRRRIPDRRSGVDRRQQNIPVAVERRQLERRAKVPRRRQIDPTTCERDYTPEEIEFMKALDEYKRLSGRMFPTCSEILEVLKKLGYEKRPQTPPEPQVVEGRSKEEDATPDNRVSLTSPVASTVASLPGRTAPPVVPTVVEVTPLNTAGGFCQSQTTTLPGSPEELETPPCGVQRPTGVMEGPSPGAVGEHFDTPPVCQESLASGSPLGQATV